MSTDKRQGGNEPPQHPHEPPKGDEPAQPPRNGHTNGHAQPWDGHNAKLEAGERKGPDGKWFKPDNLEEWDRKRAEADARKKAQQQGHVGNYMRSASSIKPKNVQWMWRGILAYGALHLLAGQPSTGKSTIAFTIAAAFSSGGKWPDGSDAPRGRVAIWSGEDNAAMTIVPRLMAAGADLDNILMIGGGAHPFNPAEDMEKLAEELAEHGDIRMLILDPVVSTIKGDSHKNAEVRNGLKAFVDLLEARDIVGIGITHFAKGTQGRNTHERVIGSVAFTAVSRVVLATAGGHNGNDYRLVVAKNNLGPMGVGFVYKIEVNTDVRGQGLEATFIAWGEKLAGNATDLINEVEAAKVGRPSKRDPALVLLKELFSQRELVPYSEVQAACERHDISTRTLKRAGKPFGLQTGIKADPSDPRSKELWKLSRGML